MISLPLWLRAAALVPMLLLAACGSQEVYRDLKETEANELVAALQTAGIESTKNAGEKEKWSVSVAQGDFARAVTVLRAEGLPRHDFESLGTVFKKEGFTSSPLAERARLNYGMSQELAQTISKIDGVVEARVHLAMPEPDPLSREVKPASASVFVKYRPGFELRSQTAAIKSLVTNSIEGLAYDKVSVVMVLAHPTVVQPATSSVDGLLTALAWIAAIGGLAIGAVALVRIARARGLLSRRIGLPDRR